MSDKLFSKAIVNDRFIATVQFRMPSGMDIRGLRRCAAELGGLANGLYPAESEDGIRLSSLAACTHLLSAGAEPILPLLTRDMNRIALQSTLLGAASLGITNILCLSGRHQAVTGSASARGVYDVDPIQMLQIADNLRKHGMLADGPDTNGKAHLTLGTDTNPFADPMDLHLMMLEKAVEAGADYVMTQPVFDIGRFEIWMDGVRGRGIEEKICIIASVMPFTSVDEVSGMSERSRFLPMPAELVESLRSAADQRAAGMRIAVDTIARLRTIKGVRGINLVTGADFAASAEILKACGLHRS